MRRVRGATMASPVRAVWGLALVGILLAALVGCGGITAPDLFILERSGNVPGARLTLLVNEEGGVHCNGGPRLKLSEPQLVQAREIQEDLHDSATKRLALGPARGSVLSYRVRDVDGSVSFSDNSAGQPKVLRELSLFTLQVAQSVCHLRM